MATFDAREFRNTLGSFATGVCLITAHNQEKKAFGMTVNSFASVSLDPPLLLWNIQNDSDCFADFEVSEFFCVNVLANDQEAISNQYAKKGEHELLAEHYHLGRHGEPVINSALSSFECKVWARYPGG